MYALFGMIALVATPVFGALCLYNKATHKKDNRMLIAFFASFAVFAICFAVTPEPSSEKPASSSVASSSTVESVEEESESNSTSEAAESESDSISASQEVAPESEQSASSEPASSEQQVVSSASSHNPDDDIPILDLDDYAKQAADNAVKAKDKYAGKRYKVTYQVNSVSDMMVKTDNPYTEQTEGLTAFRRYSGLQTAMLILPIEKFLNDKQFITLTSFRQEVPVFVAVYITIFNKRFDKLAFRDSQFLCSATKTNSQVPCHKVIEIVCFWLHLLVLLTELLVLYL